MNAEANTVRSLLRTTCLVGLAIGSAVAQDARAAHEPMFGASGGIPPGGVVRLDGGMPPIVGGTASWGLMAPGFTFGITGISTNVWPAWHPFADPLALYLDPLALLGTMPLPLSPLGLGSMTLPIPPDPALTGLDLALQALVLAPTGQVAASNLVVTNIGVTAGTGEAVFGFDFGPYSIPPATTWPSNQAPGPIVENASPVPKNYTVSMTRAPGGGALVIKDQAGVVKATIQPNQTSFSMTIPVPGTGKLFLANTSGNAPVNNVTWDLRVN